MQLTGFNPSSDKGSSKDFLSRIPNMDLADIAALVQSCKYAVLVPTAVAQKERAKKTLKLKKLNKIGI